MLRPEQNDLLTQTGPGTPMGEMFRRYWIPALLAEELPENDGPPVRVQLLSERLIAFRDSDGHLGLIDEFCAHRGVSLWFGRNEECGLRCPYHGWKYDVTGQCVDLPSEPESNGFRAQDQVALVSVDRARRRAVDLHGPAGAPAGAAGIRIRSGAAGTELRLQAVAIQQLAAGAGGRHRFQPRLLAAPRRAALRSADAGCARQPVQHGRPWRRCSKSPITRPACSSACAATRSPERITGGSRRGACRPSP